MSACCAAPALPRLAPWTCFERGLQTLRLPPLPLAGEPVAGAGERWARFSVQLRGERVHELRFACIRCTTLVACCQALVELNRGCALHAPRVHEARELLTRLPGLPAGQQACAALAAAALRAALQAARSSTPGTKELP